MAFEHITQQINKNSSQAKYKIRLKWKLTDNLKIDENELKYDF